MFSPVIIFLCIYGVMSTPTILYSKPPVNTEEHPISTKPEVEFVAEKSSDSNFGLPVELKLPGTNNNAEKIQVYTEYLPGTENLAEKAIPEPVIRQMEQPHAHSLKF